MGLSRTTFGEGKTFMEKVLMGSRATLLSIIVKGTHSSVCGDVFGGMVSLTELAMKCWGAAKSRDELPWHSHAATFLPYILHWEHHPPWLQLLHSLGVQLQVQQKNTPQLGSDFL